MAKQPTAWKTRSGYDTPTDTSAGFFLLLETGDRLLLETGDSIFLEDTVISLKEATSWSTPSKIRTSWEARDGYSTVTTGVSVARITQSGTTRITEQGTARITEDSEYTTKIPTQWNEP